MTDEGTKEVRRARHEMSEGCSYDADRLAPHFLVAVFLSMSLCAAAQEATTVTEPAEEVRLAIELLNKNEHKKAANVCRHATGLTGRDVELCLLVRSISLNIVGDYKKAIDISRQLVGSTKDPAIRSKALYELGAGLVNFLRDGGEWPTGKVSKKFKNRLREAEMAFREALDIDRDETGLLQISLADVLAARMVYEEEWEHEEEVKELAEFYLRQNPSGRYAARAREIGCLSDRYLEAHEVSPLSSGDSTEDGSTPIRIGGEVIPPERISSATPTYTAQALRALLQGDVILQAVIDEAGNVRNIKPLKKLPFCMTEEVVLAVKKWKFKPAILHGKPVAVFYNVIVTLSLRQHVKYR